MPESVLTPSAFAEPIRDMRPGTSTPRKAINTIPMWLGGRWMLRRDGKAIPEIGPFVDVELEPQHNAEYHDASRPKGQKTWNMYTPGCYNHRPAEQAVGAKITAEELDAILEHEGRRLTEQFAHVQDVFKAQEQIDKRLAQVREMNPLGVAWDAKPAPKGKA